jgi:hypothetical protein
VQEGAGGGGGLGGEGCVFVVGVSFGEGWLGAAAPQGMCLRQQPGSMFPACSSCACV